MQIFTHTCACACAHARSQQCVTSPTSISALPSGWCPAAAAVSLVCLSPSISLPLLLVDCFYFLRCMSRAIMNQNAQITVMESCQGRSREGGTRPRRGHSGDEEREVFVRRGDERVSFGPRCCDPPTPLLGVAGCFTRCWGEERTVRRPVSVNQRALSTRQSLTDLTAGVKRGPWHGSALAWCMFAVRLKGLGPLRGCTFACMRTEGRLLLLPHVAEVASACRVTVMSPCTVRNV